MGKIPESYEADLQFEMESFIGRLEGFTRSQESTAINHRNRMDKYFIRYELFQFLESDITNLLQKVLSDETIVCEGFPSLQEIEPEITQLLQEMSFQSYLRNNSNRIHTSISRRWLTKLYNRGNLRTKKILNYMVLYKNRMYSFASNAPSEYSNIHSFIRAFLNSKDFELDFEEIYFAETELTNEITIALAKKFSSVDRLKFLYMNRLVNKYSENFIRVLHSEYALKMKESESTQVLISSDLLRFHESLGAELKTAEKHINKQIQKEIPSNTEQIEFHLWFSPLIDIGGDFYRLLKLKENEYGIFLADIAGHGISAAIYLNTLRLSFEKFKRYYERPGKLLKSMNEDLYGKTGDSFITSIYIYINLKKRKIRYSNAGHPKGFIHGIEKGKPLKMKFLKQTGRVLGVFEKTPYEEVEIHYEPKQRLVLFTDGITETFNSEYKMLGERGLIRYSKESWQLSGNDTLESIKKKLLIFQDQSVNQDDRCLIITDLL